MRILGISGSLRRGSHNRTLLRAARAELPTGVEFVEWDGLAGLPAFNEDLERTPPPSVRAFLGFVAGADALLIATPEYNASVPGGLKNVLSEKPSLVIGASTGLFGAVWAQAEVRKTLAASGAIVLDTELAVAAADGAFTAGASLADPRLRTRLRALLGDLIREVGRREAECQAA